MMKKLLLTGIAALFLATGAAHATENELDVKLVGQELQYVRKDKRVKFIMV